MKNFNQLLKKYYLNFVLMLSTLGMVGSLIFSDVLGQEPCKACWYQRVALYPIVFIAFVAMMRKDKNAFWYMLPLSVAGLFVSSLQVSDEVFGTSLLGLINCSSLLCVDNAYKILGLVSIPVGSWLLFVTLTAILGYMAYIAKKK